MSGNRGTSRRRRAAQPGSGAGRFDNRYLAERRYRCRQCARDVPPMQDALRVGGRRAQAATGAPQPFRTLLGSRAKRKQARLGGRMDRASRRHYGQERHSTRPPGAACLRRSIDAAFQPMRWAGAEQATPVPDAFRATKTSRLPVSPRGYSTRRLKTVLCSARFDPKRRPKPRAVGSTHRRTAARSSRARLAASGRASDLSIDTRAGIVVFPWP